MLRLCFSLNILLLCFLVIAVGNNESTTTKNAGKLLAISIAMRMVWRYNAGRIARWSTSRDSLEATGCRHLSIACAVLPWRPPSWSTNLNETHKTLTKHKFYLATLVHFDRWLFLRISYPKMDPLFSSSMWQALFKCETPWLELKSVRTFLALIRCQRTKSK